MITKPTSTFCLQWNDGDTKEEIEKGLESLRARVRSVDRSTHDFIVLENGKPEYWSRQIEIEGAPAREIKVWDAIKDLVCHRIDVGVREKGLKA